jgi:predicted PurR-regulated permease PerM
VRQALFLGVLAGVLELIPNVGPTLEAIPAVVLAFLFGSTHFDIQPLPFTLIVIAVYVGLQFVENQFLVPYVMGDAVDLPPLVVLIGALAGAMAFGILGALLATPVIATGNLVFRYTYRKILEPPPLPPPAEEEPSVWERVKGWAGRIRLPGKKKP